MRKTFWQKKIPTLFGILLIILALGVTVYFGNKKLFSITTKIDPQEKPLEVRTTNISESSFSVSYVTTTNISGSLNLGKDNNLNQTVLDDRDQANPKPHYLHYFTARNLSSSTTYAFTVVSGQNVYNNDGKNFTVTTGPAINSSSSLQQPATGKVMTNKNRPPEEAILYLNTAGSQTISSLVSPDGSFLIPLNSMRTSNNLSYLTLNNDDLLKILVISSTEKSNVLIKVNQATQIPTITLSKDYDLSQDQTNISTQSASMLSPTPTPTGTPAAVVLPAIVSPQKNQQFTNQQPIFNGTASPNQKVEIAIHSAQALQGQTYSDANGNWTYTPTSPLQPGTHTIYITTTDPTGATQTVSQSFIVYSAQPTQEISTMATPTLSPTPIPISTFVSPTLIASGTPVISQTLPASGNPIIITAGILGIIITIVGAFLFLFTRGEDSSL